MAPTACLGPRPYIDAAYRDWQKAVPPHASQRIFQVFLIGDAGAATTSSPVLRLLRAHLDKADSLGAVVFLGDNLYCCGMPDSGAVGRAEAEGTLRAQIKATRGFSGRVVFIPGNHDWNRSRPGGRASLARQEAFIEAALPEQGNAFLPDDGLPGPTAVRLNDNLTLVTLDTEWWLEQPIRQLDERTTSDPTDAAFFVSLRQMIAEHQGEQLLIVGHHPIYSNGRHAGHRSPWLHLFPFTAAWQHAYLPLPLLGSLYVWVTGGSNRLQDLSGKRYRTLRDSLEQIFATHDGNLIYAAGYEHNLQVFERRGQHFVISGAGSKSPDYVAKSNQATFTDAAPGFMCLAYYRDGSVWLTVTVLDERNLAGRIAFQQQLNGHRG